MKVMLFVINKEMRLYFIHIRTRKYFRFIPTTDLESLNYKIGDLKGYVRYFFDR